MEKSLVGIHWNSHKNCWSVVNFKSRNTYKLLNCHLETLVLSDVSFKIDMSKKRKALEKGKKDRHTFIVGYIESTELLSDVTNKLVYDVKDNSEPFKDSYGESVIGKTVYFRNDAKVFVAE